MADSVLVVVSILEGRGFPHLQHQLLLLEGKFNGECLETDPVPHTTAPKVNTELAWELSRKSLHQHKLQRTPLKLQCSCVDERTKKKDPMGYIMLDLRQAHSAVASSNSARWYGISNSQYHGKKPELRIVITMETESHYEPIPPRPISSLSQSSTGSSHLSMVLDEEEGYYVLGERDKCGRIFIVSVMIAHHRNLSQVRTLCSPFLLAWVFQLL
jgi:centrosomal protein CEP120